MNMSAFETTDFGFDTFKNNTLIFFYCWLYYSKVQGWFLKYFQRLHLCVHIVDLTRIRNRYNVSILSEFDATKTNEKDSKKSSSVHIMRHYIVSYSCFYFSSSDIQTFLCCSTHFTCFQYYVFFLCRSFMMILAISHCRKIFNSAKKCSVLCNLSTLPIYFQ